MLLILGLGAALYGQTYSIKTIAGTAPGNNPTTLNTTFISAPEAVAADSAGNLYIADPGARRVLKVDPNGAVTTLLDSSKVNGPAGLFVDSAGNLLISDMRNHRIYKLDNKGTFTTLAGVNSDGRYSGDSRKATQAQLNGPRGVTMDSAGNIIWAEAGSHRVRYIDSNGIIKTLVGTGSNGYDSSSEGGDAVDARLNAPEDVTIGPDGALYIADTANHRIRRVFPIIGGTITTYAGTGRNGVDIITTNTPVNNAPSGAVKTQTQTTQVSYEGTPLANVSSPGGLAFDAQGRLWFSDRGRLTTGSGANTNNDVNARIRYVTAQGNIHTKFSLTNTVDTNSQSRPSRIAIGPNGRLYYPDSQGKTVSTIDPTYGTVAMVIGAGSTQSGTFSNPAGLAVDAAGNVYVSDSEKHQVFKIDAATGTMSLYAGTGTRGNRQGGLALSGNLNQPSALALNAAGYLFIADTGNNRVVVVTAADGVIQLSNAGISIGVSKPMGLAFGPDGLLYVSDTGNNRIKRVNADNTNTIVAGGNGSGNRGDGYWATDAQLNAPRGIAFDTAGNLYIADTDNHEVRGVFGGIIIPIAGEYSRDTDTSTSEFAWNQRIRNPRAVAVDAKGFVFFTDSESARLRRVDPNTGTMATIGGTGYTTAAQNYNGDKPKATDAQLSYLNDVKLDSKGNIYIAEQYNNLVRVLTPQ